MSLDRLIDKIKCRAAMAGFDVYSLADLLAGDRLRTA